MLKKITIVIGVILAGVLILAALKPARMNVSREITIAATPEAIFPYVNNTQKSFEWMPWNEGDPNIEIKYSGPPDGVGSMASWKGKKMGVGTSEIVESLSNQVVKTRLIYTEPMAGTQMATIELMPKDSSTLVRWSVEGENNFIGRIFCVFMDMEKMIGGEFDKGLNKLKSLTENKPNP